MMASAMMVLTTACKNDDDTDDNDDNNNTTTPTTTNWNLNASVDLGGTFPVVATGVATVNGSSLSIAITTSTIGGAAEVHNFTITGAVSGDTWTVTNSQFSINSGGGDENITITTGTHTISGSSLTGSGNVSVVPVGDTTSMPGTYTVTGTKI